MTSTKDLRPCWSVCCFSLYIRHSSASLISLLSGVSRTWDKEKDEVLSQTTPDYVASAAKAALGAVPFAGSMLVELAGTVIPNQRIERIVSYAKHLNARLAKVEQAQIREHMTNENFTDLMEEGLRQAARSTSDERRNHLASVIANSLQAENVSFVESKHILRILGEINDIEVIWLRSYLFLTVGEDEEFRTRHHGLLHPPPVHMGSSKSDVDKRTLNDSYKAHLAQLGLLEERFKIDSRSKEVIRDSGTGAPKLAGYKITPLGRLLLDQVGLIPENYPGRR